MPCMSCMSTCWLDVTPGKDETSSGQHRPTPICRAAMSGSTCRVSGGVASMSGKSRPMACPHCPGLGTPCPMLDMRCPVSGTPCPGLGKFRPMSRTHRPGLGTPCPMSATRCPVSGTHCRELGKPRVMSRLDCLEAGMPCSMLDMRCPVSGMYCLASGRGGRALGGWARRSEWGEGSPAGAWGGRRCPARRGRDAQRGRGWLAGRSGRWAVHPPAWAGCLGGGGRQPARPAGWPAGG